MKIMRLQKNCNLLEQKFALKEMLLSDGLLQKRGALFLNKYGGLRMVIALPELSDQKLYLFFFGGLFLLFSQRQYFHYFFSWCFYTHVGLGQKIINTSLHFPQCISYQPCRSPQILLLW